MSNYKCIKKLYSQYKNEISNLYKKADSSNGPLTHEEVAVLLRNMNSTINKLAPPNTLDY